MLRVECLYELFLEYLIDDEEEIEVCITTELPR